MKSTSRNQNKSAVELIEEAVHLLQQKPFHFLAPYYAGSLPFFMGLLYFWTDMSRNVFAGRYCIEASLGIALLFVFMKAGQTLFAETLLNDLLPERRIGWSFRKIMRLSAQQTLLQATGLMSLPIAFVLALPFAWVYAFYQNVTAVGGGAGNTGALRRLAWNQALLWPGQNHILLGIFSLFGFFVFADIAVVLLLIPQALKTLLGIDTRFTLNAFSLLNTTFLAVAVSLTHLCLDPLIKTVYVLRCYYGVSLTSGEDLLMELKPHTTGRSAAILLSAVILLCVGRVSPCEASQTAGHPPSFAGVISSETLDASIRKVMDQREFAWRIPASREEKNRERTGFLMDVFRWLEKGARAVFEIVKVWWKALKEWLEKLMPDSRSREPFPEKGSLHLMEVLLYLLLTVLACILGVSAWRLWRRPRRSSSDSSITPTQAVLDLNDENLKADLLSSSGWLEMAFRLIDQGDLRTALRAMYLAMLSQLGDEGLIRIARHKSNRDYLEELKQRHHSDAGLSTGFQDQTRIFERVWYGMHPITKNQVTLFAQQQEHLLKFAHHE